MRANGVFSLAFVVGLLAAATPAAADLRLEVPFRLGVQIGGYESETETKKVALPLPAFEVGAVLLGERGLGLGFGYSPGALHCPAGAHRKRHGR